MPGQAPEHERAVNLSGVRRADSSRIRNPMLEPIMLELREVRLRRGAAVLFDRANLTIFRGDKIGIVGRNGCGKSSLLALLRGDLGADSGDYSVPGKLNFVSVSQELPRTEATVLEYVRSGDAAHGHRSRARESARRRRRHAGGHLLGDYDLAGGYTSAARAAELADGLGFAPSTSSAR